MKRFLSFVRNKLKSDRGDSIAEVLIALLISAVALVMLASMITSSTSMIGASKKNIENYYSAANEMTGDCSVKYSGTVKLVPVSGTSMSTSFSVNYYVNEYITNHPVVAFEDANS